MIIQTIGTVRDIDSKVNILHKTIIPFLAKLVQKELTTQESELCINYLLIENELESIGDGWIKTS